MKPTIIFPILLCIALQVSFAQEASPTVREWTSSAGSSFKAIATAFDGTTATLKGENGREIKACLEEIKATLPFDPNRFYYSGPSGGGQRALLNLIVFGGIGAIPIVPHGVIYFSKNFLRMPTQLPTWKPSRNSMNFQRITFQKKEWVLKREKQRRTLIAKPTNC